jgi:hypothetical protein
VIKGRPGYASAKTHPIATGQRCNACGFQNGHPKLKGPEEIVGSNLLSLADKLLVLSRVWQGVCHAMDLAVSNSHNHTKLCHRLLFLKTQETPISVLSQSGPDHVFYFVNYFYIFIILFFSLHRLSLNQFPILIVFLLSDALEKSVNP